MIWAVWSITLLFCIVVYCWDVEPQWLCIFIGVYFKRPAAVIQDYQGKTRVVLVHMDKRWGPYCYGMYPGAGNRYYLKIDNSLSRFPESEGTVIPCYIERWWPFDHSPV